MVIGGGARVSATGKIHCALVLTERERAVCALLVAGHTQREIADQLSVQPNTVHKYTVTIREKLAVESTVALVVKLCMGGIEAGSGS